VLVSHGSQSVISIADSKEEENIWIPDSRRLMKDHDAGGRMREAEGEGRHIERRVTVSNRSMAE
jgi:hypothetical protein